MNRKTIALALLPALTLSLLAGCNKSDGASTNSDNVKDTLEATRTSKGSKQPKTPEMPEIYRVDGEFAPGELHYDDEWQDWELEYGGFPRIDGSETMAGFIESCAQALLNPDGVLKGALTKITYKSYAMDRFVSKNLEPYEAWYDQDKRVSFGHSAFNVLLLADYTQDDKSYLESEGGGTVTSVDFAKDALVFVVPEDSPVDGLTLDELRGILTGEITQWDDLGIPDTPVRLTYEFYNDELSECISRSVLDGEWLIERVTEEYNMPNGIDSGGDGYTIDVAAEFEGFKGDIAIRHYRDAIHMEGVKILAIGGVTPDADTISSGEYQPVVLYSAVYRERDEDGAPGKFAKWLLSDEGRAVIEAEGLVPVS